MGDVGNRVVEESRRVERLAARCGYLGRADGLGRSRCAVS